ncbi:hypothetical protein CU034_0474 [Enterococcus faecium]|nr:hypothetical protein [Enterococcus faecium]MBK4816371.1 hypothetical protein [Enterococcus faecium]
MQAKPDESPMVSWTAFWVFLFFWIQPYISWKGAKHAD